MQSLELRKVTVLKLWILSDTFFLLMHRNVPFPADQSVVFNWPIVACAATYPHWTGTPKLLPNQNKTAVISFGAKGAAVFHSTVSRTRVS
jgi:hypothetical protein